MLYLLIVRHLSLTDRVGLDVISFTGFFTVCLVIVAEIQNKTRTVRGSDYSPAIELSEQEDKLVSATGDTEKYSEKNKPTKSG